MDKGLLCPCELCCLLPGVLGPHPMVPPGPQPKWGCHHSADTLLTQHHPSLCCGTGALGVAPSPTMKPPRRCRGGRGAREAARAASWLQRLGKGQAVPAGSADAMVMGCCRHEYP